MKEKKMSLYESRPDLLKYIKNTEDAKTLSQFSGKRILCECPICNAEKYIVVEQLSRYGFHCTACGDGVSYPNKFVNEFLNQLGVKHEHEKIFFLVKWKKI